MRGPKAIRYGTSKLAARVRNGVSYPDSAHVKPVIPGSKLQTSPGPVFRNDP